ncbi:hypothetical protein HMPREF1577_00177 [Gardnerella pickettii JCP8017A]|uniref:Uncharacterized protein n=1 Tax=Gardnerella pickettii JCP8017A TaxID=1261062 RepID=T2PMB9_9BIFI|nr:hypothetical protein HMPREF1586_00452 [Gardnerella vaginalis JCP8522]EPI53305.1 hypothetical protein HMPREF1577_00177 [Gardnerella pickettii JCP8017A]EPI61913.1 hypothetical protein HMPREF1578_00532 [Gardnerella pickettii JCP8017B]
MLLRLHYCVYVIEDFVVMSCNILLAISCLRYLCLYANNAFITK